MERESIRARLHRLQGGLCWLCGTPLPQRGSHRHHRVAGDPSSLVLVHGRCHNKLHPHSSHQCAQGAAVIGEVYTTWLRRGQVLHLQPGVEVRLYTITGPKVGRGVKYFRSDLTKVRLLQPRRRRNRLYLHWECRCTPLSGPAVRARIDLYQLRGLGAR